MLTSDDLNEYFQNAITNAWKSPGNFYSQFYECEGHYHLNIFPALREIYGGPTDGQRGFAGFDFSINKFAKAFDKKPKIKFLSNNGECVILIIGNVDNNEIQTLIAPYPPMDSEPQEVQYAIGPKRGMVEAKVYEDDYDDDVEEDFDDEDSNQHA